MRNKPLLDVAFLETWIGLTVKKRTNLNFKSGLKVATVTGMVTHPKLNLPCFTFMEDDSYVECRRVELV